MLVESMLPNFLIVGAARSGTTSLFHYLEKHPDIFVPKNKEPSYFTFFENKPSFTLGRPANFVTERQEYLKLFESGGEHLVRGEASTPYLYFHEPTIVNILKHYKNLSKPKIIIILRNPVDRAYSQYMMNVRDLNEDLSFEKALKVEGNRMANNAHFDYFYINRGYYYLQTKAYLEKFRDVKVCLY